VEALKEALKKAQPEIFNTDQGSQFTSRYFTGLLENYGIQVSMDGQGRYIDNLFIERLWRTLKYEEVFLKAYQDAALANIPGSTITKDHTNHWDTRHRQMCIMLIVEVAKERMLESTSRTPASTIERIAVSHLNSE
jgi:transposase InsO family protein